MPDICICTIHSHFSKGHFAAAVLISGANLVPSDISTGAAAAIAARAVLQVIALVVASALD